MVATKKKSAVSKKPGASSPKAGARTSSPRVRRAVPLKSTKVDYYPNRMTVAVSALAGTLLVLLALIAVLGSQ